MSKQKMQRQPIKPPAVRKVFENPVNQERWVCENVNDSKMIDGVEFIPVHAVDNNRVVLMRKEALKPVR